MICYMGIGVGRCLPQIRHRRRETLLTDACLACDLLSPQQWREQVPKREIHAYPLARRKHATP